MQVVVFSSAARMQDWVLTTTMLCLQVIHMICFFLPASGWASIWVLISQLTHSIDYPHSNICRVFNSKTSHYNVETQVIIIQKDLWFLNITCVMIYQVEKEHITHRERWKKSSGNVLFTSPKLFQTQGRKPWLSFFFNMTAMAHHITLSFLS